MFKKLNVSNSSNFDKSNFKFLKIVTVILAILILICLVLLVLGFIKNYNTLAIKEVKKDLTFKTEELTLSQPKNSQLISSSLTSDNKLLLRYQHEGNNIILIIDVKNKNISNKIIFNDSDDWKIE